MHPVIFTILTKFEFQSKINNIMTKRLLLLLTFLQVVLGGGRAWADTYTWDLSANTGKATSASNGTITVAFGGTGLSAQKNYMGFKRNNTMSVSCSSSGYTITSIQLTFASGYAPSSNQFTSDPTGLNETCTVWSGSGSSSIVISNPGGDTRITNVTVTYSSTSAAEYSYNIPIEDLRFEHQTYNPGRTGVLGLNITTSGWQSYTNTSTTPYNYTLLLSTAGKTSNSITVTAGSAILTKVVLVGADGAGTFHNCSSLGTDNYSTTDEDQIVWMKDGGATEATISFTATDQPQVSAIYVFTNTPLSSTKQDVKLRFDPASGTADADITDFQIDGRVKATIGVNDNGNFRPDDFTASSVSNSGSGASFNQFHISTGQVGVNTGSTAGTATVTAAFSGNQFYNAATSGTYTLTVNAATATKTKTITINDMRISKTASTAGLNASGNGLDRTLGGFAFVFGGAEGVKFNNGDHIILRNLDSGNEGTITITPQVSTGTVTINKVVVNMISGYTDGTVTATGTEGDISLSGKSSHTFDNVDASSFTLTSLSGNVYIQSFTIYYTESVAGALNDALITPTITFSPSSDAITPSDSYTSPTIETSPKNFDIGLVSSNASVATVKTSGWTTAPLVALAGETGTATITASAAASTYYNAATATYTVTYTDASAEKWDFRTLNVSNTINADDWTAASGGDYYNNKFTTSARFNVGNSETYATTSHTTSQIYELLFGLDNSDGRLSAEQIRLYSSYMYFKNSAVIIAVPVRANDKVLVTFDGGNGATQAGFTIGNAQVEGDASATSINSDDTQKTVTLVAQADGYVTLKVNKSKVKLYRIQKSTETRGTLDLRDTSNSYERYVGTGTTASTDNHFSHRVKFTPSDGATTPVTYADDASKFHITSSDNSILDASGAYVVESSFGTSSSFYFANIIPKAAGTATLTITFDGNDNYKPNSYVSQVYTVYGAGSFRVQADNQSIQQGQFSVVNPLITDADGHALGIRAMGDGSDRYTTYVLGEEDDIPDYNDYFDFTYAAGTGSGDNYTNIQVDATGKITTEQGTPAVAAAVGATRQITVTATPKSQYASAFTTGTAPVSATATITIIEKTPEVQLEFYWDADCTDTHKVTDTEYTTGDDKLRTFNKGIFAGGFPNGRMLYVKAKNPGDSIWFSYNQNADAATIPAHPSLDKKKRIFEYRYGVPIYVDDDFESGTSYVTLNIVATSWDAATQTRNLNGSVARMKFTLVNDENRRPDQPTYDPVSPDATASLNKDGRKIMNTAQNVVAYGEGASKGVTGVNNMVFGKFSTSTVYTTEQLVNEKTVTYRLDNVPVVSTEVAKRRFTSVQIRKVTSEDTYNYGEYISEQTYTEYWYLYDTDLRITPSVYNIDVNTAIPIGSAPTYTVTWYNKKTGKNQVVDSYDGKITYAIADRNGAADATLDTSTGIVTSGSSQGWVRVKVTYTGGEQHGGVSGEPQYTSTTDKSEAYYYVYIFDTDKERPTITPATRNFTGKMNFTITAPANWTTYYTYTTDGNVPADPTSSSASIAAATNKIFEIGEVATADGKIPLAVGGVLKVKAIAINPSDPDLYSAVVSESYTRKAPLPDPVFDPDGVGTPYRYNTSTLTVQIACAYAGSVIYYTVDGTDPVIGNSNTYRYSGLSKVVISGNVGIKAVAYDPVQEIYSNVVLSSYQYSDEMSKPYFQISNDGGQTWYGYGTEDSGSWEQNGTKWYNNQAHAVKPTTQIRIIDPNPVTGTIFYTVDGSTPADNSTTMIYAEGYPFTVAKTTTGRAITILEDASSPLATAEFTINTEKYGNVWEAVNETLTGSDNKKGIHADDGFVISTNKDLSVAHTGSIVNQRSLASGNTSGITYAQQYITATFGGYELASWEQMTIADAAIGAPIDGIAQYNIKNSNDTGIGNGNAKDENLENYNHIYSYKTEADKKNTGSVTAATTHEKTFRVPATGGFVRFEPEKDGDLTIWCLQQGALLYEDDKYFIPNVLRIRPVYMVDEQGNSLKVKTVNGVPQLWSSARLSENWATIHATAASNSWKNSHFIGPKSDNYDTEGEDYVQYVRVSDGAIYNTVTADDNHIIITKLSDIPDGADKTKYYKKLVNKGPNRTETAAIYQLYKADLDKNHVNIGDPIKPFAIHTGTTISMNDAQLVDDSDDGTGYVLASGGYAKYTFEVKAGKSYYFFAQGSKIGIRGFQFVSTESGTRPEVSLDAEGTSFKVGGTSYTPDELKTAFADTPVNVTIKRTIKKDQWSTLVLPFSVSATQLEKLFGDGTGTRAGAPEVEHYKDIVSPNTVVFKRHKYQMIVAGTPILIWSEKDVTDPKFEGVQIEADVVETMTGLTSDEYSFIGNFVKTDGAMHQYDYYFGKNDGKLYRYTGANEIAVNGSIAWLRPKTPSASRMLSLAFTSVEEDLDSDSASTTGIIEIVNNDLFNEYNGQKAGNGVVYNLKGMKVSDGSLENLPKGVYIVNGKKVVVE